MKNFIALDVETTGLQINTNEIIELGIVKFQDGVEIDSYEALIRPQGSISKFVEKMTGITNKMVMDAPSFSELALDIRDFIGDNLVVGHSIAFDLGMLNSAFENCGFTNLKNDSLDTLLLISLLKPTLRSYKLGQLAKLFDIEEKFTHRAKHDAKMTANLYLDLYNRLQKLNPETLILLDSYLDHHQGAIPKIIKQLIPQKDKVMLSYWLDLVGTRIKQEEAKISKKPITKQLNLSAIFALFKKGGKISKKIKNFEVRSSQLDMLEQVWNSIENKKHTVIEAGTGTGKSFAYLIPSIYHAVQNQEQVIVSTKTKNLQEQLFSKDIPMLEKTLDTNFEPLIVKGRKNYICLNKFAHLLTQIKEDKKNNLEKTIKLLSILMWLIETPTGDISDLHNSIRIQFKGRLESDSYACLQDKCPFKKKCSLTKLKKKSQKANILIVNHALLLSDYFYSANILPDTQTIIFDEAHSLEDIAADCFSRRTNKKRIQDIAVDLAEQNILNIEALKKHPNIQENIILLRNKGQQLMEQNNRCFADIENIFQDIEKQNIFFKKTERKFSFKKLEKSDQEKLDTTLQTIYEDLRSIETILNDLNEDLSTILNKIQYSYYRHLCLKIKALLEDLSFLVINKKNTVQWLEAVNLRKGYFIELVSSPIYVGDYLQKNIFRHKNSIIFTSATIAIRDNFNYFLSRMGYLESELNIATIALGSPFNIEGNTLLCVPRDAPVYQNKKEYTQKLSKYLTSILKTVQGRTLILFTSHKHLTDTYYLIKDKITEFNIYCQGKRMSDKNLLKSFQEDIDSILMGTNNFWEGIDVPGKSLSTVIIVKFPFEVPTDPMVVARMEQVAAIGQSSFFNYSVPKAILRTKQGVGRLIRHNNDHGAIIILDSRVLNKGYGQIFLKAIQAKKEFPQTIAELNNTLKQWFD